MVTIISYLIVEFTWRWIHFIKPLQAPIYLVYNVRNTIFPCSAISFMLITKGAWVLLVCKHHLIDGICRGSCILQTIGSIVPSTCNINTLTCFCRVISDVTIFHMAAIAIVRIPSTTLLSHILQNKICCTVIYSITYWEYF